MKGNIHAKNRRSLKEAINSKKYAIKNDVINIISGKMLWLRFNSDLLVLNSPSKAIRIKYTRINILKNRYLLIYSFNLLKIAVMLFVSDILHILFNAFPTCQFEFSEPI